MVVRACLSGFLADLFVLDTVALRWSVLLQATPGAPWPAPRKGHGFTMGSSGGGSLLYAFGGLGDNTGYVSLTPILEPVLKMQ